MFYSTPPRGWKPNSESADIELLEVYEAVSGWDPGFDLSPKTYILGKHILRTKIATFRFVDQLQKSR